MKVELTRKTFDFISKDETTVTILTTYDPEEITEFVAAPDDPTFVSYRVGKFISKEKTDKFKHMPGAWKVIYEKVQLGVTFHIANKTVQEYFNRTCGKPVKKRVIKKKQ